MDKGRAQADLIIIGGGLAGSEAAWQAAQRGLRVCLYEMRPHIPTGAHRGADLGELVCSNSLGSDLIDRAPGLLKAELRRMGSLLLRIADETSLPAGAALAVDRDGFAQRITMALSDHARITLIREEVREIPEIATIIASGPLTSSAMALAIQQLTGSQHLYFFDAIAPIVLRESINMEIAYRASRYGTGDQAEGDYINCPFSRDEYFAFVEALLGAQRIELKEFERAVEQGVNAGDHHFFEGCLPIEILASRGKDALRYGPMRPVGLRQPGTGRWPFAVLQLRQDDLSGSLYNLVGFQTNLTFPEQKRVLRMIPGLENAEFVRFGQMHRNTFIFSPAYLKPSLQFLHRENLWFAGQITGVEGYAGNIATGLLAGWNAARAHYGFQPIVLPETTMLGALCNYITHASAADFQPMKANFGILPALEAPVPKGKRERGAAYALRSLAALDHLLDRSVKEESRITSDRLNLI